MTVYVDELLKRPKAKIAIFRPGSCHMIADSTEELDAMALRIGMRTAWRQDTGTWREHYDLTIGRRAAALKAGAVEISSSEWILARLRTLH